MNLILYTRKNAHSNEKLLLIQDGDVELSLQIRAVFLGDILIERSVKLPPNTEVLISSEMLPNLDRCTWQFSILPDPQVYKIHPKKWKESCVQNHPSVPICHRYQFWLEPKAQNVQNEFAPRIDVQVLTHFLKESPTDKESTAPSKKTHIQDLHAESLQIPKGGTGHNIPVLVYQMEAAEKAINKALAEGATGIWLIPGHGDQILKRELMRFLKRYPHIKNVVDGKEATGNAGMLWVSFGRSGV